MVFSILLLLSTLAATAQDKVDAVMENSSVSLVVSQWPSPHISRLTHKASGGVLVDKPERTRMFTIVLAKPDGQEYVDSSYARATRVAVERVASGREVVITFSDFPNLALTARVRGVCADGDALTRWSMEVHNDTGRKIDFVRFPSITAVPAIRGGADDDFIVLPCLPGTLIQKPWENWKDWDGVWLRYPGDMSAQFLAYQDASAGVFFAALDPLGQVKSLVIQKLNDGFEIVNEYFPPADTGKDWQSPYPVAIGVSQGTWMDSADIYKAWAVGQPWCAKTLARRDDIPEWWKQGPMVHVCSVRTYDQNWIQSGSYYPSISRHLEYLKEKTGGPIVAMLADWENHRRWTAGDYFPVFDEANAKKVIPQIKKKGFKPFFFLSGLFYTFANEGLNPSKPEVPERYFPGFVIDGKTGKPRVFTLDESYPDKPWTRRSYSFCAASPLAVDFFRKTIDSAIALGVDVLQMDQVVEGAGQPCFSQSHGHAPGSGLYQTEGYLALLEDMSAYGKKQSPDFALFTEEPHERLIPYLDGFHMREYKEKEWYREFPGAIGIPLFTYLYHEYAIGYGGDNIQLDSDYTAASWNVRCHAVNLVTGKTPATVVWFWQKSLYTADQRQFEMLRNHARLLEAGARPYLMEGRMLHPYAVSGPAITYKFGRTREGKWGMVEFSESSVLTSSWQSPQGGVGHVFVNLSRDRQTLEIDLDTRNAPGFALSDVSVFRSTGRNAFAPLWKSVSLPKRYSTELKPGEVLFVEIRAAAK